MIGTSVNRRERPAEKRGLSLIHILLITQPSLLFLPILFIFLCTLAFNMLAKQLEGGE